jgi:hypothetical protein
LAALGEGAGLLDPVVLRRTTEGLSNTVFDPAKQAVAQYGGEQQQRDLQNPYHILDVY